MSTRTQQALDGADNLLLKCMGVTSGDSVILVVEPSDDLYNPELRPLFEQRIAAHGASVMTITAELITAPSEFPEEVAALMRNAEHTLFLSRVGDYVRFAHLPGSCTKTTSYALDAGMLGSPYASICHHLMKRLLVKLETELMNASVWRITCPLGTDISGTFCWPSLQGGEDDELTVTLFPVATFKPVPCGTACGQVALSRWLLPGAAAKLAGADLTLDATVMCDVEQGLVQRFHGTADGVAQITRHYNYVSESLNIARNRVHSWHIGVNPQTHFNSSADNNRDQWCAVSFGSPRYLHFHTCGDEPPGEIAWSVFNPTVMIDGESFWQDGQFAWLQRADSIALIKQVPGAEKLLDTSLDIGI